MSDFNIFSQLQSELHDFFYTTINIAGNTIGEDVRYLTRQNKGYQFSQWKVLNTIEMYYNSKFESGDLDSEGQRKTFLNIGKFRSDVASKQIDIDVKDFTFVPDEGTSVWPAYFLGHKFRKWAKNNYFGELLNQMVDYYPRYGSVVIKRVGNKLERVPLLNLRNQQDAKSLNEASYVIEEHKEMTSDQIQAMKAWDTTGLEMKFGQKTTVYERYGRVPLDYFKEKKGEKSEDGDQFKTVYTMAVLSCENLDIDGNKKTPEGGTILFFEKASKTPYEEDHWSRQDGRWLGIGEIENQFENQIMRNMVANMRRRALLWSSKKVFQSSDPEMAKNLIRDVKDGDVLKISMNGNISQVNMTTQNLAEFQQAEQDWEKNSDQKSFTFEAATGESLPSGTPFRLGVLMTNAVTSHFNLKRENLGLFLTRVVQEQLIPVFNKENKEPHSLLFFDEEGVESLKQELSRMYSHKFAKEQMLSGVLPDFEAIKAKVEQIIAERKHVQIDMPKDFYSTCSANATLVVTGENVNVEKRIETLTTLYTSMVQAGDQRAERILSTVLALTGENYDLLAGVKPPQPVQIAQQSAGVQIQQAFDQGSKQPTV